MTSRARIEANRKNAEKSTGPRTASGRAAAAGNARTHGLTAPPDRARVEAYFELLAKDASVEEGRVVTDAPSAAAWELAVAEARLERTLKVEHDAWLKLARYLWGLREPFLYPGPKDFLAAFLDYRDGGVEI